MFKQDVDKLPKHAFSSGENIDSDSKELFARDFLGGKGCDSGDTVEIAESMICYRFAPGEGEGEDPCIKARCFIVRGAAGVGNRGNL
jgi:hypothetical protein